MRIGEISEYVLGCCEVEICGWFGEALLNEICADGTEVWNIVRKAPDVMLARVFLSDLGVFDSKIASNKKKFAGVSVKELRRWGLPTKLDRLKVRGGLLCGAAIFILAVILMSSFLWDIKISGTNVINDEKLLSALYNDGIYIGAFASGHDLRKIKLDLMEKFPNIAFVGINIKGSTAYIDVTERRMPPLLSAEDLPCNIYAKSDGVIVDLNVYNGVSYVKEYEAVSEGQLLVGGIYDSRIVGYRLVSADASAVALTKKSFESYCPLNETVKTETGRQTFQYAVSFFGFEIHIPLIGHNDYEDADVLTSETQLRVKDSVFPISLITYDIREVVKENVSYSENEAKENVIAELSEITRVELSDKTIVEKSEDFRFDGKGYKGTYTYTLLEDIAERRVIETEDVE